MSEDLIVAETLSAATVYAPGAVDAMLEKLERDVRAVHTDVSTRDGRAAISSLAFKVSRSKTALDELGKNLVADWKARSALVDADRRRVRERLDALRDEVRRPLTEWEDAERRRVEGHEAALLKLVEYARFDTYEPDAERIADRLARFNELPPREWHEFSKRATDTTAQVRASLQASHAAAVRREAERAELLKLRKEAEERTQRERDDRLQREAAEQARATAEAAAREAARVQAAREAAERARIDRERVAAEEARLKAEAAERKARRDAEDAAEIARIERLELEEKAQRDAEAAVEAERRRAADERATAEAEQVRRETDEKHKKQVHDEIAAELARRGYTVKQARTIVDVLATGGVPHVRIEY